MCANCGLSFFAAMVYIVLRGDNMLKEEIWSVSMERARAFFRTQEDVLEESSTVFCFKSARVTLTELKPKGMGVWAAKRIKLSIEGGEEDVQEVYHRFFMQFLSTGG